MIAVIGCGDWGKNLARNFASLGVLSALVDADPERAQALGALWNVPYVPLHNVLDDENIVACAVATPAHSHAQVCSQLLEAGKHVFVEKPLTLCFNQARELVQNAQEQGKILMIGHLIQYHPAFLELKSSVLRGAIGKLLSITTSRLNFGKIYPGESVLWNLASHDVSLVLALVHEDPLHITSQGHRLADAHEKCSIEVIFPHRIHATINVSVVHPFKQQSLIAMGDKGTLVFDDTQPWEKKLALYSHEVIQTGHNPLLLKSGSLSYIPIVSSEPLLAECSHFLECITTSKNPLTDGHEALRVMHVLSEAEKALLSSLDHDAQAR